MKMYKLVCSAVLLAILPTGAFAFDMSNIRVNGFVSQGYLDSQNNNFLDPNSEGGSYQLNEVGLTINAQVDEKLRVGIQLLSRDLGDEGNNDVVLDWAVGDYRINNLLGVRAGKIKMPMGLYNEGRDSDMLRPMVFLPQSIYDETWRSFMSSAMGAGLYGNVALGDFGDIDYQVMTGQVNIPDDSYLVQVGLVDYIESQISAPISKFDYENDSTVAASLVYNTPLDGLRFGLSYLDVQGQFDGNVTIVSMPFAINANIKDKYVVSAEYVQQYFSLRGEYMQVRNDISDTGALGGMSFIGNTAEGYYVMASAPVADSGLTVSALYDVYYANKDDHGNTATGSGYRKDFGIGARYDVNKNCIVKAEYHDIEGTSLNLDLYNLNSALDKDWSYFVAKVTFFF